MAAKRGGEDGEQTAHAGPSGEISLSISTAAAVPPLADCCCSARLKGVSAFEPGGPQSPRHIPSLPVASVQPSAELRSPSVEAGSGRGGSRKMLKQRRLHPDLIADVSRERPRRKGRAVTGLRSEVTPRCVKGGRWDRQMSRSTSDCNCGIAKKLIDTGNVELRQKHIQSCSSWRYLMQWKLASLCAACAILYIPWQAAAACLDVRQSTGIVLEGVLSYHIFPGSPNFEDVRRGDQPEPTYILQLDQPICATGDEFLDENSKIDRIQIFPGEESSTNQNLSKEMRRDGGPESVRRG